MGRQPTTNEISQVLMEFVESPLAQRISKPFRRDPCEAAGEIFLRLCPNGVPKPVRKTVRDYVWGNAPFHLRNWLIMEHRHAIVQPDQGGRSPCD